MQGYRRIGQEDKESVIQNPSEVWKEFFNSLLEPKEGSGVGPPDPWVMRVYADYWTESQAGCARLNCYSSRYQPDSIGLKTLSTM